MHGDPERKRKREREGIYCVTYENFVYQKNEREILVEQQRGQTLSGGRMLQEMSSLNASNSV